MESKPASFSPRPGDQPQGISWGRFPLVISICVTSVMVWLVVNGVKAGSTDPPQDYPFAPWLILKAGIQQILLQQFFLHVLFYDRLPHLLGCVLALAFAGRMLETRWGSWRFGFFCLWATFGSGLAALLIYELQNRAAGSIRQETWIFGGAALGLACLTACSLMEDDALVFRCVPRRYLLWVCIVLGSTGLIFLEQAGLKFENHRYARTLFLPQLSGIFLGWAYTRALPFADIWVLRWKSRRREKERERIVQIRFRVDELLQKISATGRTSLSPEEEAFLKQASKHFKKSM